MAANTPLVEVVDLVDNIDHVVGTKRRDCLVDGVDRWRMVVVFVTDSARRVLLARRGSHKRHAPGAWAPCVAGTVSSGDDYLESAVRETSEEIGLSVVATDLELLYQGLWDTAQDLRYMALYRLVRNLEVSDLDWDRSEADELSWFAIDSLRADVVAHPARFVPRTAELLALLR